MDGNTNLLGGCSVKVYICHPFTSYGNPEENMERVREICLAVTRTNLVPVSPIHAFSFLPTDYDWERVMEYCIELLGSCDQLFACKGWKKSRGCREEVLFALRHNIPVYEIRYEDGVIYELKEITRKSLEGEFL